MQKILKDIGLAVPTLVLALTALVTVPAFADHGSADTSGGNSGTGTSTGETETSGSGSGSESTGSSNSTSGKETAETAAETHANPEAETALKTKGAQMVTELETQHKSGKTQAQKTQTCEAHKQGLTTKFAHITTNATNLETRIGTFLTKAQTYKSTNNVTISNWDSLVAAANTAKGNVDTAIANLKAVTPSLDCNSTSVASDVATFKAAAQDTRDALQGYKTAVKNVFVALQQAKGASTSTTTTTTTTTEGSNQ